MHHLTAALEGLSPCRLYAGAVHGCAGMSMSCVGLLANVHAVSPAVCVQVGRCVRLRLDLAMLELGVGVCSRRWPDTRLMRHVLCSFFVWGGSCVASRTRLVLCCYSHQRCGEADKSLSRPVCRQTPQAVGLGESRRSAGSYQRRKLAADRVINQLRRLCVVRGPERRPPPSCVRVA